MKLNKFLTVLICLTAALSMLLCACGDPTDNQDNANETTAADTTASADATDTQTPETKYDPLADIPVEDFEKYTFNIIAHARNWAIVNMTATDITGDTIQDAIYERQLAIEERLNIKLEESIITSPDVSQKLMEVAMQSGEDGYDLGIVPTDHALKMYTQNYVYDQTTLENLDLNNPWWEQNFNQDVNVGPKRYITFGNANLVYYSSFYIFAFNKEMIDAYSLENPYELVASGKWTWDKTYEMMKVAAIDNNNDGVYAPGEDIVGMTGHINPCRNLILSSGATITIRDQEGYPVYEGLSDRYISAFTKFTEYFITSPYAAIAGKNPNPYANYSSTGGIDNYAQVFADGKALILVTGTNHITMLRQSETEYGIVVVPKYDEAQENYITPVYSATEGFVIPMNAPDPERTALILETLGALSYQNLVDKHIGTVLHYKVASDPVAIENINMAYATGTIDCAMANNFGTCTNILNNLNVFGNTNITSTFKQIENKLRSDIEQAIDLVS